MHDLYIHVHFGFTYRLLKFLYKCDSCFCHTRICYSAAIPVINHFLVFGDGWLRALSQRSCNALNGQCTMELQCNVQGSGQVQAESYCMNMARFGGEFPIKSIFRTHIALRLLNIPRSQTPSALFFIKNKNLQNHFDINFSCNHSSLN